VYAASPITVTGVDAVTVQAVIAGRAFRHIDAGSRAATRGETVIFTVITCLFRGNHESIPANSLGLLTGIGTLWASPPFVEFARGGTPGRLRVVAVVQREIAGLADADQAIAALADTGCLVVSSLDTNRAFGVRARVLIGRSAGDTVAEVRTDLIAVTGATVGVTRRAGRQIFVFANTSRSAASLLARVRRSRAVEITEALDTLAERAIAEQAAVAIARTEAFDATVATLLAESALRDAWVAGGYAASGVTRLGPIAVLSIGTTHIRLKIRGLTELTDAFEFLA
jgi:hypothetical protein